MKWLLYILVLLSIKSFGQDAKAVEFDSIQDAFASPTKVKSLDLSNQSLTKLPVEIVKLTNLEEIDLGSNPNLDLAQAFDILKQISSLKIIWLKDGKINAIPNNLSQIKSLEVLYLDNNELNDIPEPIRKLNSLKILSLFNNKIKTVKFKKGDLPNLIAIDLCYNQFEIFPVGLSVLHSLQRIIIWDNSIVRQSIGGIAD
jgi:leucine-rich repeat protein SHOC2